MDYLRKLCKLSNSIKYEDYFQTDNIDIYHYTSPGGFQGIIKNIKLRLTDRDFLNDYSEGNYVMELCINNIQKILTEESEFKKEFLNQCKKRKKQTQKDNFFIYQCSFSTEEDSLCLWNYYTKGDSIKGYNLHFKSKDLADNIKLTSTSESGRKPKVFAGKVIYDESKQLEIIKDVVGKFVVFSNENKEDLKFTIEILIDKLMFLGVFFKKSCFSIEKEFRIVLDLYLDEKGDYAAIKEKQDFYEKNGFFVPYIDVSFEASTLLSVMVSPTLELDNVRQSVYRITKKNFPQFKDLEIIRKSQIPVRY